MTAEGGKPLTREPRRGRVVRRRLRLLRGDRPRLGGAGDSLDRGDPALDGRQGPGRGGRLHRPLELPAAAAHLEARPGARGREHHRLQALGADPDLDPDARRLPRSPAGRRRQPDRRRRRGRRGAHAPTRGSTASPSPARSRPASGWRSPAPSGSPGSTSRWAARTRSSSAPTSAPRGSRSPPAAAPGPPTSTPARSAPPPSASTSPRTSTTTTSAPSSSTPTRWWSAIPPPPTPTSARWSPRPSASKVVDQVEAAVAAGAELLTGGGDGGNEHGHYYSPAVITGASGRDRAAARGDLRPGGPDRPGPLARRGDRARQRHPLRPRGEHLHLRPEDDGPLHARDQGRDRLVQRSADRQRRRPLRRLQAVGDGAGAGPRGARGLPGDQARPRRDRDRPEGVVVPLRRRR